MSLSLINSLKSGLSLIIKFITLILLIIIILPLPAYAQPSGTITGNVVSSQNTPLPGVNVFLANTNLGAVSDSEGDFKITRIPYGSYILTARFIGYNTYEKEIFISGNETIKVNIVLTEQPVKLEGIVVTESRSDETAGMLGSLTNKFIQRNPATVTGELLRNVSGVDAVRRGPTGLDPVVRGMRETEVGTYVDGTRYFPGGAARMDSPLSHYDPMGINHIQVIKGPYALTWGAGNLTAIRVESPPLPLSNSGLLHGKFISGYQTNIGAGLIGAVLTGNAGNFSYYITASWREGNNYTSGNGTEVPAGFHSREIRAKLGFNLSSSSSIIVSGGYQKQNDLDYPGRLLDARYFNVYNFNARYKLSQNSGTLRNLEIMGYINNVDHFMDNNGKPTALPDSNRMPPFPLLIDIETAANVKGGKLSAELQPDKMWKIELGADLYSVNRDARRNISRRDNGMPILTGDIVWPDATITDAGVYTKVVHPLGSIFNAIGTIRLDYVSANANTASDFFLQNVSADLNSTEVNLNGALIFEAYLNRNWIISLGFGTAVRTADASERYSDRFPSSKAQMSAEFMGNPALNPERSNQVDLWIESNYERFSLNFNFFARRVNDYITLNSTDFPKKLPLSPPTVFQYVNGEADFWGFEAAGVFSIIPSVSLQLTAAYLWGENTTINEPLLGITPFRFDAGLRYQSPDNLFYIEGVVHSVSSQDRVAVTLGETPSDTYITADIKSSITLMEQFQLSIGVLNLTDVNYANHLNAKNPFTGERVPEPGRVFYSSISFLF